MTPRIWSGVVACVLGVVVLWFGPAGEKLHAVGQVLAIAGAVTWLTSESRK